MYKRVIVVGKDAKRLTCGNNFSDKVQGLVMVTKQSIVYIDMNPVFSEP